MRYVKTRVTPAMAQKWIEESDHVNFRRSNDPHVSRLAREMSSGNWTLNGETIKLRDDGLVLDGMHRLKAIVRSGVSIETFVLYGAIDGVFDEGRPRTIDEHLKNRGYPAPTVLSSALRCILYHERTGTIYKKTGVNWSNNELLECLDRWPSILSYIGTVGNVGPIGVAKGALSAILAIAFNGKTPPPNLAIEFAVQVKEGEVSDNARCNSGVLLRNRMLKVKATPFAHMTNTSRSALTVIAWNHFIQGSGKMRKLTLKHNQELPAIFTEADLVELEEG